MDSDPKEPLIPEDSHDLNESDLKVNEDHDPSKEKFERQSSIMSSNFKYPSSFKSTFIREVISLIEADAPVKVLKNSENAPIPEENESEGEDNENAANTDGEDENAGDDKDEKQREDDIIIKKKYSEFLKWKVFENQFNCEEKLSLYEADKSGNLVAFKINEKHLIKILKLDEGKEYTFKENQDCPIEFLRFIEKGKKIVMANRIFLFVWCLDTRKIKSFNLMDKYKAKNLPIDDITSKIAKNYGVSSVGADYILYFTISKMIFSFRFNSLSKDFKFKFAITVDSINTFFALPKNHFVFSFALVDQNQYVLEIFEFPTLKPKKSMQINFELNYISAPMLNITQELYQFKFMLQIEKEMQYLSFSLPKTEPVPAVQGEGISKDASKIVPENNETENAEMLPINYSFKFDYEVLKTHYASGDMIILETKPTSSLTWDPDSPNQAIFDGRLLRSIQSFDANFTNIIIYNSIIFAYLNKTLTILTIGMNKFEGILETSSAILSVSVISNLIFIECEDSIYCWKMKINEKTQTIDRVLDQGDYEKIITLSPEVRQSLIDVFCYGRDPKSLEEYLKNKEKFKNVDDEIETLNIGTAIDRNSLECIKVLFDYFINLEIDPQKLSAMIDDIEENLTKIISSGASNLIPFLDKLLVSEQIVGQPYEEELPAFQFVDNMNEPLDRLFFDQNATAGTEHVILTSLVKIPSIAGSKESRELTYCISNVEELSLFTSKFIKYYIRTRWNELWGIVLLQTVVIWSNCLCVMLVIDNGDSLFLNILLLCINFFLIFSEALQVLSLGFQDYIGIVDINYFANLTFFACVIPFVVLENWYIIIPYSILQFLSLKFESNQHNLRILLRTFPYVIYFGFVLIFPNHLIYAFVIMAAYELVNVGFSFLMGIKGVFERSYLKLTISILFLGYGTDSLFLLLLYACVYLAERGDQAFRYKQIEPMGYFLIVYETINMVLFILGYLMDSHVWTIVLIIMILLLQVLTTHQVISRSTNYSDDLRLSSITFSFYLFIAFFDHSHPLFVYSFFFYALLELFIVKNFEAVTFKDDLLSTIMNWNTIDLLRALISFAWIIFTLLGITTPYTMTWTFAALNFARGLTGFRVFEGTRFYLRLILNSVVDIASFLIIFIYITIAFGVVNSASKENTTSSIFEKIWVSPYDFALGNFEHGAEFNLEYFSFLVMSLLMIIVMLNLLISILGESFSNFQEGSVENDYKEMIETIYECETLLFWRRLDYGKNYFAICDKWTEEEDNTEIPEKIDTLDKGITKKFKDLQKEIETKDKELKEKITEIISKKQEEFEKKLLRNFNTFEHQLEDIKLLLANRQ